MAPTRTGKIESLRSHYFPDPFSWVPTRRVRSGQPIRLAFGFAEGSLALRLSSIKQIATARRSASYLLIRFDFKFTNITSSHPTKPKASRPMARPKASPNGYSP